MKLIDSLTMGERLFLLALLGGNGLMWGFGIGMIAYYLDWWHPVIIGSVVTLAVAVGALMLLERIHNAKQ